MRLIDADALIEAMKKTESEHEKAMACPSWWSAFNVIGEQPTAYSVENVVEELEELKMRYFLTIANTGDEKSDFAYENVGNALDKAIEIVKQGGVSDDVCEWKLDGVYLHSPHKPLVSCVTDEGYRYYYCPVCGKKIKIVGD